MNPQVFNASLPLSPYAVPGFKGNAMLIEKRQEDIINAVCHYTGVHIDILRAASRKKEYTYARQLAMYLLKEYTLMSFKSIAQPFGGRDHTTAIHSINRIKGFLHIKDDQVVKDINNLILLING